MASFLAWFAFCLIFTLGITLISVGRGCGSGAVWVVADPLSGGWRTEVIDPQVWDWDVEHYLYTRSPGVIVAEFHEQRSNRSTLLYWTRVQAIVFNGLTMLDAGAVRSGLPSDLSVDVRGLRDAVASRVASDALPVGAQAEFSGTELASPGDEDALWFPMRWVKRDWGVNLGAIGAAISLSFLSALALAVSSSFGAALVRARNSPDHCCKPCGYDMRGLWPGSTCPECGHAQVRR